MSALVLCTTGATPPDGHANGGVRSARVTTPAPVERADDGDVRQAQAAPEPGDAGGPRGRHLPDLEPIARHENDWEHLTLGARWGHRALYHPGRNSVIVVGGMYDESLYDDAWEVPLDGRSVPRRIGGPNSVAGLSPDGSAVLDTRRDRLVVFGGSFEGPVDCCYGYAYGSHRTTQALPLSGGGPWSVIEDGWCGITCPEPPWRFQHVAVYDARRDRMVMFGGGVHISNNAFPQLWARYFDAWALSLEEPATWGPLATSGDVPSRSAGGSAVLDAARDRMLYVWGDRVWSLHLETLAWDSLEVAGPGPGEGCTVAIDEPGRRLFAARFGRVWRLDLEAALEWRELVISGPGPSGRGDISWDARARRLVTFGGGTSIEARPSVAEPVVWTLEPDASPASWSMLFDGRVPRDLSPFAAYDTRRDRLLVLGHEGATAELVALSHPRPDWRRVPGSVLALGSDAPEALILDEPRDRLLLEVSSAAAARTLALPLDGSGPWSEVTRSAPGYWWFGADDARSRVVRLGFPRSTGRFAAQALVAGPDGERWAPIPATGDAPTWFLPRAVGHDPVEGSLQLIGMDPDPWSSSPNLRSIWTLTLGDTIRIASRRLLGGLYLGVEQLPAAAFDPVRRRWFLHGVYLGEAGWIYDTYLLGTGSAQWSWIGHVGEFEVPPRRLHAAVYDARNDRILLAGGELPTGSVASHRHEDAWAIAWPKPVRTVRVDVRPGSASDAVRPGRHADLQIGLLSDHGFDALDVSAGTVRVAGVPVRRDGGGRPMTNVRDLDGDGLLDVLFHVDSDDLPLAESNDSLELWGLTVDYERFEGLAEIDVRLPGGTNVRRLAGAAREPAGSAFTVTAVGRGGSIRFACRVPPGERGSLEVFDLAGRRVAAGAVGGDGSRDRPFELEPHAVVHPGLYFARLRSPGSERRARVLVLP